MASSIPKLKSTWLVLAVASGACAAFNGVFAKLTTTELTASWAKGIAAALGLKGSGVVEVVVRGLFFSLNLLFNAIMWGLFTRALILASSTVRVSIINTSANFMITAFLGACIFRERLPGLWWLGAAMLVAGSVIIGRREEGDGKGSAIVGGDGVVVGAEGVEDGEGRFRDSVDGEIEGNQWVELELEGVRDEVAECSDEDGVLK